MSIKVGSAAYNHGDYFKVNVDGKTIEVEGDRGIGLVVLEKGTRKVLISNIFDTHLDQSEANKLAHILEQVKPGNTIIMGIKDEGIRSITLELVQTVALLGSNLIQSLSSQDSWAFVVRKGNLHSAKEVKDSHNAVELSVVKKPLLHHILITSASLEHGNSFTLTINDHPDNLISYNESERGLVLLILDKEGKVRMNQVFDTHESPAASDQLEATIQSLISQYPGNLIILGVKDEASRSLSTSLRKLIGSLGSLSIHQLGHGDSWCFIARLGKPQSAKEMRDSHHSVTLSWVPSRQRLFSAPYTIHYNPPNLVKNPNDAPIHMDNPHIPLASGLVDYPVHNVHHRVGEGVGVGVSVNNNRARRRETLG